MLAMAMVLATPSETQQQGAVTLLTAQCQLIIVVLDSQIQAPKTVLPS